MDDGTPTLEVGFSINAEGSFDTLKQLQDFMQTTEFTTFQSAKEIERVTGGMVKLGNAGIQVNTFGNELTRLGQSSKQTERDAESMIKAIGRQIDVFGKSASEVRAYRAELRAMAADEAGNTDVAQRLRATVAEYNRLEASGKRATSSVGGTRQALQGLSFQAQDAFTQISMGTNVLSVLAIQGGQAAGQMANMGGKLGAVANFMIGPWGLAITGGMLVLGALTKGLFDSASAADRKAEAAKQLATAIDNLAASTRTATTTEWENQRATLASAAAYRQQALDARTATIEKLAAARADLATALAASAKPNPLRGQDGGLDFDLVQAGQIESRIKGLDGQLAEQQRKLAQTTVSFREAQMVALGASIAGRLNSETGATREYQKQLSTINAEFRKTGDVDKYAAARLRLERTYAAEKESLQGSAQSHRAATTAQRGLTDAQRDSDKQAREAKATYDAARKASSDYADTQDREAATLGMTAKQMREYADAAAIAKAVTAGDAQRIRDSAAAREKAFSAKAASDFQTNILQPLQNELALYGLVGPARAAAALELEKEAFIAKNGAEAWREYHAAKSQIIARDASADAEAERIVRMRQDMDLLVDSARRAGEGMERAFGRAGGAIGGALVILAEYQKAQQEIAADKTLSAEQKRIARTRVQVEATGDLIGETKKLFKEHSTAYKAMEAAEKAYRLVQFAMSVQSMVQNVAETLGFVANSAARSTAAGAEGIATQSKLPFPYNIAAMAATGAALVAAGIAIAGSFGGGSSGAPPSNTGTGSVLGDPSAKSDSIKNAIDALKQVDLLQNTYSRQMAASLRSIDNQIGGVASLVARSGDINANAGVTEGFKMNGFGSLLSKIPLIGGILGGLFGSKTTVTGSGLYGGAQSVGSILDGGFDASYYSDIQKKKKLFGITTGTSYSTQYSGADPNLENQFSLILRSFNDAIAAAAVPLGESTLDIQNRLRSFVVDIGRIDLQGLSGTEIQEKLSAVFGKAADGMANAAFPGLQQFQKVGEGLFETLVRVASTAEAVTTALDQMAGAAPELSIAAKLGLADQFDSISDFTSAVGSYFEAFYTSEEQAAAKTAQFAKVFDSLGLSVPGTLAAFRALVEAQDLNTAAGQATYATLLQLAPAFADLQASMEGAKSAADIASERNDLQRQLLQLRGDAAAIRALDLAKVDPSNRALQQQIWDMQDAQEAAKAAQTLADAWKSVGDTIMTEINRIRGLTDTGTGGFAQMLSQFNAANVAARGGDQDAAKSLPGLSQALLAAALNAATSKQEYDRIRAQTAASLEATYGAITALTKINTSAPSISTLEGAADAQNAGARTAANDDTALAIADLRAEMAAGRQESRDALAQIAGNTGRVAKKFDDVTELSGGNAIATVAA